MIKDLTSLKWKKNIYYISDDVIFDIESRKKTFDIDCCGIYLVDIDEKLKDGAIAVLEPEAYIEKVPYIVVEFTTDGERILKKYFPLQGIIEEGDKVIDGKVIQTHPDVYNNKYINKFNQEIFDYIKKLVKDPFNSKNLSNVMLALPDWLTIDEEKPMTEDYINKYFLKGQHYNNKLAIKGGSTLFFFKSIKLGIGEELYPINIWNENVVKKALGAIYAEILLNKLGGTTSSLEFAAEAIKEMKEGNKTLSTFLNINYIDENPIIRFESLCAGKEIDTYYEYLKSKDTSKYFTLLDSEEVYNSLINDSESGLSMYYTWSDQANAPYKEDLWNTAEGRAANINDAKQNPETGELLLDEAGNYIYENCERCWQGAIHAPGAKFPWIVVKYEGEAATITFKYTYPDGTVKTVNPWGEKVFGGNPEEPRRVWGVASLAGEFEDNDFLLGGTFDINRFQMILNPVE